MTETGLTSLLKEVRQRASVTQEQLAEAIGVSRQTIISIERGNYTPSVVLALKLAHHFNTPVENLFRYDG